MANELIIPVKYVLDGSDLDKAAQKLGVVKAEEIKLETEMNDVANAAKRQATEFAKAGDAGVKAAKDTEKQYNVMGNSIGSIGRIIAGAFAVNQIIEFGKAVVNVGAEFQSLRLAIDFASGSAAEGAKNFQFLQELSQRLGIDLLGAAQGFKQIVASSSQAGITNAETRRIFESVATAARAMGLSTNDMNGIFLALSQVISKGTVQAEELRGQIGERLPGAFNIAARAMGVTTQELNKMLEQGQVLSKDFLPAFATELQKTFEGALPAAVDSTRAEMARLSTTWDEALTAMSESTDGFVHGTVEALNYLAFGLKKMFEDPVKTAKDNALSNVTDFEAQMLASLRSIMNRTKEAGGDVNEAIESTISGLTAKLTSDLGTAKKELDDVNAKINNIPAALQVFGLPKALTKALADATARVSLLTGELGVLATIGSKLQADGGDGDKEQLGRIEKLRLKIKEITTERDKQVGLTQKEANAYNRKIAALQKELDLLTKLQGSNEKRSKAVKLSYLDELESYEYSSKTKLKILKDEAEAESDLRKLSTRNLLEELDKREAYQRAVISESLNFAMFAANAYAEFQSFKTEERIRSLEETSTREQQLAGDNAEAKKLIEEDYNRRIAREKEKQFKIDQAAALFQIAIDTAVGVTKAYSESPLTFGLPFSAFIAAQGVIQAALVKSQPIPKFAKGTRAVTGGTPGEDSVLAMLMPGERVVTTEKNRQLGTSFDVLTDSKRSPQFWNKTLLEIEKLGVFTPPSLKDLPPAYGSTAFNDERIVKALNNLTIERFNIDENGFRRRIEKKGSFVTKLNKHYGF